MVLGNCMAEAVEGGLFVADVFVLKTFNGDAFLQMAQIEIAFLFGKQILDADKTAKALNFIFTQMTVLALIEPVEAFAGGGSARERGG